MEKERECSVCLKNKKAFLKRYKCDHELCRGCAKEWHGPCPVCRALHAKPANKSVWAKTAKLYNVETLPFRFCISFWENVDVVITCHPTGAVTYAVEVDGKDVWIEKHARQDLGGWAERFTKHRWRQARFGDKNELELKRMIIPMIPEHIDGIVMGAIGVVRCDDDEDDSMAVE